MTKAERLYDFYDFLRDIHMEHYPDLRFGQLMEVIFCWIRSDKKRDPFYVEEDDMKNLLSEYISTKCQTHQTRNS